MTGGFLGFVGGIGLFLFGMETMTAALRALAAERLRRWLLRMTSIPLRGVLTGAGITALIQSSTAVTVMTIGFVGAGLVGFAQSLGVIYGASIGTTVTGWMVVLVGVKLKLGVLAFPILFCASLMGILGDGRISRLGRMLAGLSLMFIGLDLMQASTTGMAGLVTPERLPGDSWRGRLALVGVEVPARFDVAALSGVRRCKRQGGLAVAGVEHAHSCDGDLLDPDGRDDHDSVDLLAACAVGLHA